MSSWWRPSSTAEEPEDRVQTRRQAAAAATKAPNSPTPRPEVQHLCGRELNRVQRLEQRVRSRSRDNYPAESPLPSEESAFSFPTTATAPTASSNDSASAAAQPPVNMTSNVDDVYIQRIVKMAIEKDREERDRQSSIATQAAVPAALANQTSQVQALRKPDLPPFDKDNVEI